MSNYTIKQIIPCNQQLYAVVNNEDSGEDRLPVLLFALVLTEEDGEEIWPLTFDPELGVLPESLDMWDRRNIVRYEIGWRQ